MGLLDDAIREHLELKRKHGASEEEVRRAEQEALAPARRDPAADAASAGAAAPEELAPEAAQPAAPPVDEPVYADEYAAEPGPADLDEPPAGEPAPDDATRAREVVSFEEPGDAGELMPEPPDEDMPAAPDEELVEAPEPGTPKPHGDPALDEDDLEPDEVPADEQLSGEPDPYRARTSILDDPLDETAPPPPAQPPAGEEEQDVLEETPDFLQETPEHDKLWFEQKPPRDFDFD